MAQTEYSKTAIGNLRAVRATVEEALEELVPPKVNDNTVVATMNGKVVVVVLGSLEVKGSTTYFDDDATEEEIFTRIETVKNIALDFGPNSRL